MTHHVIFFRSRWVSLINLNLLFILLVWPFYNFKSSMSNTSDSLFGRRKIHPYPIQSSHLPRWLPEVPVFVVPPVRTFLLLTMWKMRLPKTRALPIVPIWVVPLLFYLLTLFRAPFWFLPWFPLWFPPQLSLCPLQINCLTNSWRLTWSQIKDLNSLQRSTSDFLRLKCRMCTIKNCIWTASTFVSSAKIILRLLGPPRLIGLSLQLFFSVGTLLCARRSTCVATKVRN